MGINSEIVARIRAAIASPERSKRLIDFIYGNLLYALPVVIRRRMFIGTSYYCPICDNTIRNFLPLHRSYHLYCPICHSLQRHRLVWLFYNSRYVQLGKKPERMLHIAPEPALTKRFHQIPGLDYLSADLLNRSAMMKMDICDIQLMDCTVDIIYCSHVLEHVQDDHQALREFHRILCPEGYAVLIVPVLSEKTIEGLTIVSPVERQKNFGQHDHVRSYGLDFKDRVEKAGFDVQVVEINDLTDSIQAERMGLGYEEKIFYCKKA